MVKIIDPKLGERIGDFACGTGGFLTSALKVLEPQIKTIEDRELYIRSVYGIEKKPCHISFVSQICYYTILIIQRSFMETHLKEIFASTKQVINLILY